MGSGHKGLWVLHRMLHRKGPLSAQQQRKKAKQLPKITRNKAEKKIFCIWGSCSCQHTHTVRDEWLENICSCSIPPSWRQDLMDFWSGPCGSCVWFLRKLLLGSCRKAVSPCGWLVGETVTQLGMTLRLLTVPQFSNHGQGWRSKRSIFNWISINVKQCKNDRTLQNLIKSVFKLEYLVNEALHKWIFRCYLRKVYSAFLNTLLLQHEIKIILLNLIMK